MIARLALAAALFAAPALAQPPPPPEADAQEPPRRQQVFISPAGEPFRAPRGEPYPVVAWFARVDADRDGAISRQEFTADALAFHARLDTDKDGQVDGFEIADYETAIAPEILSPLDRGDEGPGAVVVDIRRRPLFGGADREVYGRSRNGAGLYGLINEVQPVMAQDADFDRRIDTREVAATARDRFAILDRDRDGKLILATLPKTPFQTILEAPAPKKDGQRRGPPPKR